MRRAWYLSAPVRAALLLTKAKHQSGKCADRELKAVLHNSYKRLWCSLLRWNLSDKAFREMS